MPLDVVALLLVRLPELAELEPSWERVLDAVVAADVLAADVPAADEVVVTDEAVVAADVVADEAVELREVVVTDVAATLVPVVVLDAAGVLEPVVRVACVVVVELREPVDELAVEPASELVCAEVPLPHPSSATTTPSSAALRMVLTPLRRTRASTWS
jgi:hypothetical protein